jgi:tetratricopeptide (TPR) repeat protein
LQDAQATFDEAERITSEKLKPDDPIHGSVLQVRGALRLARGDLEPARRDLRQARDLLQEQNELERVADASVALGEAAAQSSRLDEARIEFSAAVDTRRKIFPEGHWAIADAQSRLGNVLYLSGDRARGSAMMSEALRNLRATRPARDFIRQAAERRLQSATPPDAAAVRDERKLAVEG